jgi:XTP/dITP diphosphohydrolase
VKLVIATGNAGKMQELREMLGPLGFTLLSLSDAGLSSPEEPFATFQENADLKARDAARSGMWALGDDSGLCVDALDGAPGVHSARYAPTDVERRAKLLQALRDVPYERRGAHFFCAMTLAAPRFGAGSDRGRPSAAEVRLFRAEGRVDGRIVRTERGTNGFGYDPLFEPTETPGRTIAELPSDDKNRLSHRGRALERLRPLLTQLAKDGDL